MCMNFSEKSKDNKQVRKRLGYDLSLAIASFVITWY
jgi:hypothetical protein